MSIDVLVNRNIGHPTQHKLGGIVGKGYGDAAIRAGDDQSMPAACGPSVVFSNELLDAMPVRRWGWDAALGCWFEWGVDWDGARFVWARLAGGNATRGGAPALPEDELKDGFVVETCEAAAAWWGQAAEWLRGGRLRHRSSGRGRARSGAVGACCCGPRACRGRRCCRARCAGRSGRRSRGCPQACPPGGPSASGGPPSPLWRGPS